MRLGMSYTEARDLSPDDTERFFAVSKGWRNYEKDASGMVRPGVRKATQADFDRF